MYCKGDYQLRNGIAHEDQAQWPCSPGLLAVQNGNPEAVEEDDGQGGRSILESLRKSSTNVERLFSIGGLTATDHRAALAGELDQILFFRENALMANFKLEWE